MKRRFPLQVHISTLFLILMLVVGAVLGGVGYSLSRQILESTADELTRRIHRETLANFTGLMTPAGVATRLLARDVVVSELTVPERMKSLPFIHALLNSAESMTSLYVGYGDGDFFMLRRLWDNEDASLFHAPPGTRYMLQHIEREVGDETQRQGHFVYYDAQLKALGEEAAPAYAAEYDPRQRAWYQSAVTAPGPITTRPYRFFSTGRAGVTLAMKANVEGSVVGVDIRLETLSKLLAEQRVTPSSRLAVVNAEGQVVATDRDLPFVDSKAGQQKLDLPQLEAAAFPVLSHLKAALPKATAQSQVESAIDVDGRHWRTAVRPFANEGGEPLFLIAAIPDDELMAEAERLLHYLALAMVLVLLLAVPLTFLLARRISRDLMRLAGEAEAVRRFEFTRPIGVESMILEVNQLATAMSSMKRTIQRFMDISMAVAGEKNFSHLLPRLLDETLSAAEAEAGVLYLHEGGQLVPMAWQTADGAAPTMATTPIDPAAAGPLLEAALRKGSPLAGELTDADRAALGVANWHSSHNGPLGIAVPLLNREHVLVGAMVLFRREATDVARLRFVEALSGNAAVSLESRGLIQAQKRLFESFIQLIASAIDAKSPYTGGHCARVPALSKMLAEAVCAEEAGPYADFQLDDDGWEAMHVAAWLHDCGKVTTPEYVVDKATKLETLYDRIHEIRMRFEVLKRDAEIAALKATLAGEDAASAHARLAAEWQQLDDDFAFVATCNEGGEFMAPEKQARLREIAARTWLRTLDDRQGISHEEKARKNVVAPAGLPVAEPLIADKPEHRLTRRPCDLLPPGNPLGIKMAMPELLYNRGELYNLSVARGTLSEEERFKINDHIVQTLVMLNQLPFPDHLRNVPEIAGGHHEKMDGTGYPKRLTRDEMSPLARMIAIADIFEALTAVDRPYKQGKKLSEAIRIMAMMKREQHIDPELFDIFLRSGTYQRYAMQFMRPEQIDAVDIAPYLG